MFLATLFQPFHQLFSRSDAEGGSTDPEKTPTGGEGTSSERDRLKGRPTTYQGPLNAYILPSSPLYESNRASTAPPDMTERRNNLPTDPNSSNETPTPDSHSNSFRSLPLISSIFVPFSILLAIPGLTDHWYIQTNAQHEVIGFQRDPLYIKVMLGFSMGCAAITNVCLLIRLFEKMVRKMTAICIIALTIHDILDIIVIILFIIKTQEDDGFSLGQAFWMTLCSTIASLTTNITLILDYWSTSEAERDTSGLTVKQRSLTIVIIVLLCYVAFGAAVHMPLLSLTFINALYFTVVCIETVGFGDIDPTTPGARAFSSIYTVVGILILAVAIGLIREALLEAIQLSLYARIRRARRARVMSRWLGAVKWRLENARLPVWISVDDGEDSHWPREMERGNGRWKRISGRWTDAIKGYMPTRLQDDDPTIGLRPRADMGRKRLNLRALSEAQLQAAAMEAGAPLKELLPEHPDHFDHHDHLAYDLDGGPVPVSPTHHRMGKMISLLGSFAYVVSVGQHPSRMVDESERQPSDHNDSGNDDLRGGLTMIELEREKRRLWAIRIIAALVLFFTFWLVGSAIFTVTEGWSYGLALYFCFITFSTVGYGDPVPQTPAGRSFFVAWALCGAGAMTILISLLADRYSERYKNIIFAAEESSMATDDAGRRGALASPVSTSCAALNDESAIKQGKLSSVGEPHDIFGNEMLSRLDVLRELVTDVGAYRDGRLLHSLESELESMLTLIRHSRGEPSEERW